MMQPSETATLGVDPAAPPRRRPGPSRDPGARSADKLHGGASTRHCNAVETTVPVMTEVVDDEREICVADDDVEIEVAAETGAGAQCAHPRTPWIWRV